MIPLRWLRVALPLVVLLPLQQITVCYGLYLREEKQASTLSSSFVATTATNGRFLSPGREGYRGITLDSLGLTGLGGVANGGLGGDQQKPEGEEQQSPGRPGRDAYRGTGLDSLGLTGLGGAGGEGGDQQQQPEEEEEQTPGRDGYRGVGLESLGLTGLGGGAGGGGGDQQQPEEEEEGAGGYGEVDLTSLRSRPNDPEVGPSDRGSVNQENTQGGTSAAISRGSGGLALTEEQGASGEAGGYGEVDLATLNSRPQVDMATLNSRPKDPVGPAGDGSVNEQNIQGDNSGPISMPMSRGDSGPASAEEGEEESQGGNGPISMPMSRGDAGPASTEEGSGGYGEVDAATLNARPKDPVGPGGSGSANEGNIQSENSGGVSMPMSRGNAGLASGEEESQGVSGPISMPMSRGNASPASAEEGEEASQGGSGPISLPTSRGDSGPASVEEENESQGGSGPISMPMSRGDSGPASTEEEEATGESEAISMPMSRGDSGPGSTVEVEAAGESEQISLANSRGDAPTKAEEEEANDVVQFILSLQMPESDSPPVVKRGDIETWACYLDGFITEKLARTSSRGHVVDLVTSDNSYDSVSNTITLEMWSGNDPDKLLRDVERSLEASALNAWLQKDLPASNAFDGAEVVDLANSLAQATIASDPLGYDSFNTTHCGTARVGMTFGFFDDLILLDVQREEFRTKYQSYVANLMCSTRDYFTTVYGNFMQGSGIEVIIDRMEWELDPAAPSNPLKVSFDIQAVEPTTGRRLAPVAILEWMAKSDMGYYVQKAVWTALPYEESIFNNANGVFFDGLIRGLDKKAPEQTMSTLDCVDGVYAPGNQNATDPGIVEVTKWVLDFGFEDGFTPVEPTKEEVKALFCQTYFYYSDILKPDTDSPFDPIVYANWTMDLHYYSFTPSAAKPLTLSIDAQAWFQRGARVNPHVLRGTMEQTFNINTYITKYVWKSAPKGVNVMSHTASVHSKGSVRERDVYAPIDLNSSSCFDFTEAPSTTPTNAPSESMQPTLAPTSAPSLVATNGTDSTDSTDSIDSIDTTDTINSINSMNSTDSNGGLTSTESVENESDDGDSGDAQRESGGGIGGIGGIGSGIGGFGGLGEGANGGINNGPQSLGGSNGFGELGSGALSNRPSASTEEEPTDEENIGGGIGGDSSGLGGGIGGIGAGIGGGGDGVGGGLGTGLGSNSDEEDEPTISGAISNTIKVETSFVAIHLPDIPVSDGSDHVSDALADMFQQMISNKPRPGMEPPQRRQLVVKSQLDKESIEIGNITPADCTHYYDVDAYADGMECSRVEVKYDVRVKGAESEEDLKEVKEDYKNMTDTGIQEGKLQESLDDIAPDSGLLVTSDREEPKQLEEQEPQDDNLGASHPTEDEGEAPSMFEVPEPPEGPTNHPSEKNIDVLELEKEEKDKNPPLWKMLIIMIILFILGLVTGMNVHRFCAKKEPEEPADPSYADDVDDERLLY